MRKGKSINLHSGDLFWPLDAKLSEIKVIDIAHSLSMICRANGHYKHFYSVAQHSIFCAEEAKNRGLSKRVQLACLLHDGSEAYIGDITRPIKGMLHEYIEVEKILQQQIYTRFGLADLSAEELHHMADIDDAMLNFEMTHLLDNPGINDKTLVADYDLSFQMMSQVRDAFIDRLSSLIEA